MGHFWYPPPSCRNFNPKFETPLPLNFLCYKRWKKVDIFGHLSTSTTKVLFIFRCSKNWQKKMKSTLSTFSCKGSLWMTPIIKVIYKFDHYLLCLWSLIICYIFATKCDGIMECWKGIVQKINVHLFNVSLTQLSWDKL